MSLLPGPRLRRPAIVALAGAGALTALLLSGPAAGPALGSTPPQWSITPTPNSNSFDGLNGVSCPSRVDCWAVGTANPTAALMEKWNGTAWKLVPAAAPVSMSALESVDCVDTSDCWTVGRTSTSGSDTLALTEHWDGHRWTSVPSPAVPGSDDTGLFAVTCTSSIDCWTVGTYFTNVDPPATQTLAEHWDGTSWSIVATPNTASAGNDLNGISCVSASDCWSTGQGGPQALAERWNGQRWSIVATPTPSAGSSFGDGSSSEGGSSVVCVSAEKCWAVGYGGRGPHALVEKWNGTVWKVVRAAKPAGSALSNLYAVTCATGGTCRAVGSFELGESQETLAEVH